MEDKLFNKMIKSLSGIYIPRICVVIDGIETMCTEAEVRYLAIQYALCPNKEEFNERVEIYDDVYANPEARMMIDESGRFEESFNHSHILDFNSRFSLDILKMERGIEPESRFNLFD